MTERASAYHEAGHAVAALLCGEGLYGIQIARPPGAFIDRRGRQVTGASGLTETTMGSVVPEILKAMIKGAPHLRSVFAANVFRHVFLDGAGEAAEARAAHTSRLAIRLGGGARGDWDHSTAAVEALGFRPSEAEQLADETWERTARLITGKARWPAVVAIAEAVLSGETDGDRLEQIGRALLPDAPTRPFAEPVYLPDAVRQAFPGPYVSAGGRSP